MHTEQLRYFALAYRSRNFSAAAKQVPMSPQGLTKSIHSLETELKVTLFDIDKNGDLVPTSYADELLHFSEHWDACFKQLNLDFDRLRSRERHEIKVGISLGILGYLGPEFLSTFRRDHPHITLRYDEVSDRLCEEGLDGGTYNLALVVGPYRSNYMVRELYETPVYYWVSSNDPLAQRDSLTIEDFEGRSVALPGKDFKCHEELLRACRERDVQLGDVYTSAEIFRLYEFAARGNGLGFTAEHLVEMPLFRDNGDAVALPLRGAQWRFGICFSPAQVISEDERAFCEHCVRYLEQLKASRSGTR